MRSIKTLMTAAAFAVTLSIPTFALKPAEINLPDPSVEIPTILGGDDEPEVKARVARVSFLDGEAQIKRIDGTEWEKLNLNLAIVEGDEITTGHNTRVEIQFDSYTHLRLDEDSYLKMTRLADAGIALSLSQGTAGIRANNFDKTMSYFEIDAPGTTIALQKSGQYRIDAGREGGDNIRLSVADKGEARVYTQDSGFTVKNGRSTRVSIAGPNEGEWDTDNLATFADDFDTWTIERDAAIAKNLDRAYYDKYYDRDIYGAEDLSNNGDWVYTRKYGYVWRPYRSATSSYSNWTPYRYGHWRWISPFGWTWVNDEPWGWATYHHGRWVWDDGYWSWSPYGQYRYSRSWWSPALVVVSVYNNNVCWYPLPYQYAYYNYNHNWNHNNHGPRNNGNGGYGNGNGGHGNGNGNGNGNGGHGNGGPTPSPTPGTGPVNPGTLGSGFVRNNVPPLSLVPSGAVVTVAQSDFGTTKRAVGTAPLAVANAILRKIPNDVEAAPTLPTIRDINTKVGRDIRTEKPKMVDADATVTTGAAVRETTKPLDTELRTTRVFGGRPPLVQNNETVKDPTTPVGPRRTGAVDRPEMKNDTPIVRTPRQRNDDASGQPVFENPRPTRDAPVKESPRQPREEPVFENPRPTYEPPQPKPQPRNDPPPPKSDPPPQKSDDPPPVERKGNPKDGL